MSVVSVAAPLSATTIRRSLDLLRGAGTIRIDDDEAAAVAAALDGIRAWHVDLFGSRADPLARGGDIDLLVLSPEPAFATARRIATRFFARCEEKIDVVVVDPDHLSPAQAAFIASARRVRIT